MKKIKISYGLILLLCLFAMGGFLKEFLIILTSIVLHELGHLLMIKLFKGEIYSFSIGATGARLDANLNNIKHKTHRIIVDLSRNYYKFNYYNYCFIM